MLPDNPAAEIIKTEFIQNNDDIGIMKAPIKAPIMPVIEIPPDVPCSTFLKFFMLTVLTRNNVPISVPHVSEQTTARHET